MLQQAQIIVAIPLLYYLAPLDAVYGDALELCLLPSGRAKLLYLSLVSTAYRPAGDCLVPFGYHVLNGCVHVGEGRNERGGESLKLPPWLEKDRERIEEVLPPVRQPYQKG